MIVMCGQGLKELALRLFITTEACPMLCQYREVTNMNKISSLSSKCTALCTTATEMGEKQKNNSNNNKKKQNKDS